MNGGKHTHTPGPWEFGKARRWLFRDNLKHGGNFSSSTVLKIDDAAFAPSEADAHLIAAAPDGLSFADAFLAYIDGSDLDDLDFGRGLANSGLIEQARAFVAKASPQPEFGGYAEWTDEVKP